MKRGREKGEKIMMETKLVLLGTGIHISPNIKKGVLIFYDQNILRCLLGTGIIRKRL